jgi:hypothetical protein
MRDEQAVLGNIVRVDHLRTTQGMLAGPEHIEARREGAMGRVVSRELVGDDVIVWVKHGRTTAPYWQSELRLVGVPDDD